MDQQQKKKKNNAPPPPPPPWLSVPQFGDWEQNGGGVPPDYSMDFSKIREMRKQNKREVSITSLGNEDEFRSSNAAAAAAAPPPPNDNKPTDVVDDTITINPFHKETSSVKTRRRFWNCFGCFVKT